MEFHARCIPLDKFQASISMYCGFIRVPLANEYLYLLFNMLRNWSTNSTARISCNYHYFQIFKVKNGILIKKKNCSESWLYKRKPYSRKRQSTVIAREFQLLKGSAKLRAIVAVTFTFPIRSITMQAGTFPRNVRRKLSTRDIVPGKWWENFRNSRHSAPVPQLFRFLTRGRPPLLPPPRDFDERRR